MNKIKRLFLKSISLHSDANINNKEELVKGIITPYGKKIFFTNEEKLLFVKSLSAWETDVYLLLLEGYTVKETAQKLSMDYFAAFKYKKSILKKLHVDTRAELIMNYRDIGAG